MDAQAFLNDYMSTLNPQMVQEFANVQPGYGGSPVMGPVTRPQHNAGYKPGPRKTGAEKMVDLGPSGLFQTFVPRV